MNQQIARKLRQSAKEDTTAEQHETAYDANRRFRADYKRKKRAYRSMNHITRGIYNAS